MATSRTGTGKWKRNRATKIAEAKANGLTHCPGFDGHTCGIDLDFDYPQFPNSAEVDHIVRYSDGGTDALDNLRVICRFCNLGRNQKSPPPAPDQFPTLIDW
jgi:5-methylcytosine-specific restriction endonuclease McrA